MAIVARDDGPGSRYLAAYLVTVPGATADPVKLRRHLAEHLPDHMIPGAFVRLNALPLSPTGKLDTNALPPPVSAGRQHAAIDEPQTATEAVVAEYWRNVLRLQAVGRSDDFFELGGHSLTALQVVSNLRDRFKLELALKTLFEARTLAALAAQVDFALQQQQHALLLPPITATAHGGPAALSYSQERMWLIQSLDPENTAYNMVAAIKFIGPLAVDALSQAFEIPAPAT